MPNYRRAWRQGGTYFFTVNLLERRKTLLTDYIDIRRDSVRNVHHRFPFTIHGWVVLPEHLHCIIELPEGDNDFPLRWRLIKSGFSKALLATEYRSEVRQRHGERGIWQRRYWEHLVRNEAEFAAHMDYVHFNPTKHGLVNRVQDWPYSTFHKLVA